MGLKPEIDKIPYRKQTICRRIRKMIAFRKNRGDMEVETEYLDGNVQTMTNHDKERVKVLTLSDQEVFFNYAEGEDPEQFIKKNNATYKEEFTVYADQADLEIDPCYTTSFTYYLYALNDCGQKEWYLITDIKVDKTDWSCGDFAICIEPKYLEWIKFLIEYALPFSGKKWYSF